MRWAVLSTCSVVGQARGTETVIDRLTPPSGRTKAFSGPRRPGRVARVCVGVAMLAAAHEQIGKLSMNREKSLKLTRRCETPHHLLAHPGGLVRISARLFSPLCCRCSMSRPSSLFAAELLLILSVTITRLRRSVTPGRHHASFRRTPPATRGRFASRRAPSPSETRLSPDRCHTFLPLRALRAVPEVRRRIGPRQRALADTNIRSTRPSLTALARREPKLLSTNQRYDLVVLYQCR